MTEKLKIEDCPNFVKDTKSKAILNTNIHEILDYKSKKATIADVNKLKQQMNDVNSELTDIKSILVEILNKINR